MWRCPPPHVADLANRCHIIEIRGVRLSGWETSGYGEKQERSELLAPLLQGEGRMAQLKRDPTRGY